MPNPNEKRESPRHITVEQAIDWLRSGKPGPEDKAVVVDRENREIAVLLNPQEFAAMLALMRLTSNPEQLLENRVRIQKMRKGETVALESFLPGSED